MIGRLVHSADFERLLATPMRSRSAHFAVHHVAGRPSVPASRVVHPVSTELSTVDEPACHQPVDDLAGRSWLGSVIPKRHARRSVTRNLLRRQIRNVMLQHESQLPGGLWLVRLRSPFAPAQFPSAASKALRHAARDELSQLLTRAAARVDPR